jgi:hypothetical protein
VYTHGKIDVFFFLSLQYRVLLCPGIPENHRVVQVSLKLVILLPLLPKCWDYRNVPPL